MLNETQNAEPFEEKVGAIANRKRQAQSRGIQSVWRGLGMFGLVGWSITIPTLLGVLIGVSIDARYPGVHSWTLTMMFVGLFIGCLNAWHWVAAEQLAIRDEENKNR